MQQTNYQTRQKGVGLIEILVALMVFSMGMLGIASLQVISKRSSFEAQQRQEAVLIANDMISRIKNSGLTSAQIKAYYHGNDFAADPLTPPATPHDCLANSCTVDQLVAYDLSRWHKNIYGSSVEASSGQNISGLASAKGCIDVTEADGAMTKVTVTVAWLSLSEMSGSKTRVCAITDGGDSQREVSINTFI